MLSTVVGTLRAASEDNVNILVAGGLDDSSQTLLSDTHESVGVGSRFHSVDSNPDTSISSYIGLHEQSQKDRGRVSPFLKPTGKETPETSSR